MTTRQTFPKKRSPEGVVSAKPIALRLKAEELQKVQAYAEREQRSVASFARLAMLRGLAEYERDKSSLLV